MEASGTASRSTVPISLGSGRFRTVEADGFHVTDAWFPPGLTLTPHTHDRSSYVVMLEGSFDVLFSGRTQACPPASVLTEPASERHGNRVDGAGARVLVVQPDPARTEILRPCGPIFERVAHFRHAGIASLAWRLAAEIHAPDAVSPLVIEGTVLEMLAATARLKAPKRGPGVPPWLARTRDLLHARFLETLSTAEIAAEVGVHPVHLGRVFRAHHRMTVGAYVRGLRLHWAAGRLARSRDALSDIALEAGFADQSHFTRAFRRHLGTTPDRFRRSLAPRR
jgi:AraC-like DNA-binding protein/quercetin dioxygenase-like cupin family protein